MQITADLIDWGWASSAPSASYFLETLLDDDSADDQFGTSCYDLPGGWADSTRLHGEIADALEAALETDLPISQDILIRAGLTPLFCIDSMVDELGLREFPDEGYAGSFSPARIAEISAALNQGTLDPIAQMIAGRLPDGETHPEEKRQLVMRNLEQWRYLLNQAIRENKGLLIHFG